MSQRFNPGFLTMDAKLLVERTFDEVRLPLWVERVGISPDFNMPPDFGFACIHKAPPNRLAIRHLLPRFCREHPSSIAPGREVVPLDPVA